MKKFVMIMVVMSLLISAPVFAEETQGNEMPGVVMENPMRMGMSGMGMKCCPMMGKTQMVATDEGGVIVLAGSMLMKYDADLNLVKEVEVKMPMGRMGGKQCPMMGKMGDQGAAPAATAETPEKTV